MKRFIQISSAVAIFFAFMSIASVAPNLNTGSPVDFFTKVASRLLSSEMNLDLTRIEIYPTNQYTPAVHRLLQVTANICDAMTTNSFPSVFRPVFSSANGIVFITGYTNVASVSGFGDPVFQTPVDAADLPAGTNLTANVYGIPWIIGVKKGFPNFNEFSMEDVVGVTRKLQVTRPFLNAPPSQFTTNQMYVLSISNSLGVECWNSYYSNYLDAVEIAVADNVQMTLTNDAGMTPISINVNLVNTTNEPAWPGSAWTVSGLKVNTNSFLIPLNTAVALLTNSVYVYGSKSFIPIAQDPSNYLDTGISPLPHFGLLTTNRLRVVMLDGSNVIDYVQFAGPDGSRDLSAEIADPDSDGDTAYLWSTNYYPGTSTPWGVIDQINVSLPGGSVPPNDGGAWESPSGTGGVSPSQQQAFFLAFFLPSHVYNGISNLWLSIQAPYTPTRYVYQYTSWQANDPLVHYLASDLNYITKSGSWNTENTDGGLLLNLGKLNTRYMPWSVARQFPNPAVTDPNAYNLALQDPVVFDSDDWYFPTNELQGIGWLGRVHRGTPWLTVYLKAPDILSETDNSGANIGTNTWVNWTGDSDASDAAKMAPVRDWHLASLLAALLNTNDLRSLFSINNPDPNAWQVLLDGLTAWTNSSPDTQVNLDRYYPGVVPQFDSIIISSNSPQAAIIANAIQSVRVGQAGRLFHGVGDVLGAPALTEQSPFLNVNDTAQLDNGISDEAYEKIPSQLLPLLRADSIGSAGFANGQAIVQFTGYDGHNYVIQTSPDLVNWVSISTNSPVNGIFSITNSAMLNANSQFYRSILLQGPDGLADLLEGQ